jgi:uncharacterized protein YkwD
MNRGTRNASARARRARFLLPGLLVLAAVGGGSLYLARGAFSASPAPGSVAASPGTTATGCGAAGLPACPASPDDVAVAVAPAVVTVPPRQAAARAHPAAARPASAAASPHSPSPRPAAPVTTTPVTGEPAAPVTGKSAAPPATSPASTGPASTPATAQNAAAAQVLALINQARATAGLPALTVTAGLAASSSAHNLKMAGGCGLSHQCPGEAAIGDRETAAGVHWTAAGENIGEGGPVAGTDAAIALMAVGLTQSMLDEQPPNDGHRMNILSTSFTHVGIAVYRDGSGTVWLTQDFSN